jgi:hypothetical protein
MVAFQFLHWVGSGLRICHEQLKVRSLRSSKTIIAGDIHRRGLVAGVF